MYVQGAQPLEQIAPSELDVREAVCLSEFARAPILTRRTKFRAKIRGAQSVLLVQAKQVALHSGGGRSM